MAWTPPESQTGQLSPDGRWRWDGVQWVPAQVAPASPAQAPQVGAPPIYQPPAPSVAPPASGIAFQFGGDALWSIVFGLASILVPLFTPIYFPILPIFGLWRGVLAIRRGRVAGGVIGLVVSALGGLASLLASGLIH